MFFTTIKKESQFLFAESFFIEILSLSEIEKINCMKEGLSFYNQFLRNIKVQFNDLNYIPCIH